MKTLVFCNRKGGVGKTTSCRAVAAGLSKRINPETGKPYRTLAIDMDSQGNLSLSYSAKSPDAPNSYLLLAKEKDITEVIVHKPQGDIIPTNSQLDASKLFTEIDKYLQLKKALKKIDDLYDICCVDTSGDIVNNTATINSLVAADEIIIPLEYDEFGVDGLLEFINNLNDVKEVYNPNLNIAGLLITRFEGRGQNNNNEAKDTVKELAEVLKVPAFNTFIRKNISLKDAATNKQSIFDFNPKSNGAADYNEFINELISRGVI